MQKITRSSIAPILLSLLAIGGLTAQEPIVPAIPVLIRPSWSQNDTTLRPLDTLRWHKAANALTYRVQVATNSAFSPVYRDSSGVSDTTLAVLLSLSKQKYYWRVKSFNGESESGWSAVDSFATFWEWFIPPPVLLAPQNNSTALPAKLTLICSSGYEATLYHFRVGISHTSLWTNSGLIFNDSTLTDTTVTIGPLTPGTKYYWHVRAKRSQWGIFSPIDSFTVMFAPAAPALAYPIHNATNMRADTLILRWRSVEGDSNYVCQLWTYTFNGILLRSDTTKRDATLKVTGLMNRSKYYWRVMAFNQGGAGEFSAVDSFTTVIEVPPQVFTVSPKGSCVSRIPFFVWKSVLTATKYHLQVASANNFGVPANIVVDTVVADTTVRITDTLYASTTYYWRVAAQNLGGEGPFSVAAFFMTEPCCCTDVVRVDNEIPKEFALLQNYPNPFNPSTTIRFDLPKDAYVKIIVYDVLGREVTTLVDGEQSARRYRIDWSPSSLSSGVYFYRIFARSLDGSGEFSAVKKLLFVK